MPESQNRDHNEALDEIRRSEAKLRRIIDTIPALVSGFLPDGSNEFMNQRWHDYTGLSREQSQGGGWQEAVHPDDLAPVMNRWREVLVSGEPGEIEARLRRHDGVYRRFFVRAEPLRDDTGNIVRWYATSTDIEDLKQAEEKLRQDERELHLVIDTIPSLAWSTLPDGSSEYWNKRWYDYSGLTPEECLGSGWLRGVHPEDVTPLMNKWAEVLASGEAGEGEARFRRHDGVFRWFLIRAAPLRNETGKVVRWYGISTDIQDRKQVEEKLRQDERELRRITDAIPQTIIVQDADGIPIYANKALLDYAGLTIEDLSRPNFRALIAHPEDFERLRDTRQAALLRGLPFEIEVRGRSKDGQYRWFLARYNPFRDERGRLVSWYVAGTDIEDRKRAEEEARRDLQQIIDAIPHQVFVFDANWNPLFANQPELEYTGLTPQEAQSKDAVARIFHPEDFKKLEVFRERMRSEGAPFEMEARIRGKDGQYRWFLIRDNPLRDEQGRVLRWYGTRTDIEDRKEAEEALRKTQADLARAERIATIGELAASIAHEVNQPISGVVINANTCLRWLAGDPPNLDEARETARRIVRDGKRAGDVIARIRALAGKAPPAKERLDMNEVIRDVVGLAEDEVRRNGVTLRTELAADLAPVLGDRVQLQQVALNLVMNAVEAERNVGERPLELIIRTQNDEADQVRVTVQDMGIGLDPESMERIFDAFYTTKDGGMGMGLSISRSIVHAHGGRLWAVPNDGPGSAFQFTVPKYR